MNPLLARFQDAAHRLALFREGDVIIAGISGGCDSMVMASLLLDSGVKVIAAHVNYGLRGQESDEDEAFVRSWCASRKMECHVLHPQLKGKSHIQETARDIRYAWFRELLEQTGAQRIAVGHHQQDQAETIVHHLIRGSGIRGARGMLAIHGDIIRPLLGFTRTELEMEASRAGIPFRTDSSNQHDTYTRNLIRHQVITALEQVNPAAIRHIYEFGELMTQYAQAADEWCRQWMSSHVTREKHAREMRIADFDQCPYPDVMLHFLLEGEYTYHDAAPVRQLTRAETGSRISIGRWVVIRDRERLRFTLPDTEGFHHIIREIPATAAGLRIDYGQVPEAYPKGEKNTAWLDENKVSFPIVVRNWSAGDRIEPLGMSGHQKVSDILVSAKVPLDQKNRVPVVEIGGEIAWVAGLKASRLFSPLNQGGRCVVIKLIHNDLGEI